jgi:hypothetical protein
MPQAATLRELLAEIRAGFTLYAPILIEVSHVAADDTSDSTTSMAQPLDWQNHYTREYASEPFHVLGPNHLAGSSQVTIGRGRSCDVKLENESVSKLHATFACDSGSGDYYVTDESSRNGTCINGEPLTAGVRMPIWSGAYVSFGDAVFVFIDPPTLRKLSKLTQ